MAIKKIWPWLVREFKESTYEFFKPLIKYPKTIITVSIVFGLIMALLEHYGILPSK